MQGGLVSSYIALSQVGAQAQAAGALEHRTDTASHVMRMQGDAGAALPTQLSPLSLLQLPPLQRPFEAPPRRSTHHSPMASRSHLFTGTLGASPDAAASSAGGGGVPGGALQRRSVKTHAAAPASMLKDWPSLRQSYLVARASSAWAAGGGRRHGRWG